ncbi:hypothetical protein SNE40_010018 [Patella caerulea]|uniref:BHLH domain-containing protein n=1 Tax=Patella caerulea TaxID=87958 RepID=A0AAN8JTM1_PATCE
MEEATDSKVPASLPNCTEAAAQQILPGSSDDSQSTESMGSSDSKRSKVEKYNLRRSSLVKRIEVEEKRKQPREQKPKTKPPPLSKYRRKSANARERTRMNEMNVGFERLREALPALDPSKVTKLTLLRLAMNYINSLREVLGYSENNPLSFESSGGSTYSSSSGDENSFSPVSDFLLSDGCTDDLMNLNLDELLP